MNENDPTLEIEKSTQYGVATNWKGNDNWVYSPTGGSKAGAEKYRRKLMERDKPPIEADVVKRETVRILGPWEDVA